ncbi:MAG: response regulator [Deltaproteobacteria bacterium]|nr:response regulator [Deltaproteobacteria bacterium]
MRALIVDDSPTARALARIALEDAAAELELVLDVDEAGGGVEALRVLTCEDVAVLIVDLHMPDVHGLEVLSFWRGRVRVDRPHCAVVISTEVSPRDREKALERGPVAFVDKPVSSQALVGALASLAGSGAVAAALPSTPPASSEA